MAADAMQVEGTSGGAPAEAAASTLPEVEMYAFLLVLTYLIDQKKNEQVGRTQHHHECLSIMLSSSPRSASH